MAHGAAGRPAAISPRNAGAHRRGHLDLPGIASAGQPEYVCTAVYKILTDGAVRLAEHTVNNDAEGLKRTFADMSAQVSAAGDQSTDAAQRTATEAISDALADGSRLTDPKTFLEGDFATIGRKLDGTCA